MRNNLPYSEILQLLTELVENESNGTLFVHSECNHAITFALNAGRIHAIFHGARRGHKAIPLISKISGGTYRFEPSDLAGIVHELPSTPEILNLLRTPHSVEAPKSTATTSAADDDGISKKDRKILCQLLKDLLADHLGPIAEMVFEDAVDEVGNFCSTPELTQELINKLSDDIDDAKEVVQFKEKAYAAINKML